MYFMVVQKNGYVFCLSPLPYYGGVGDVDNMCITPNTGGQAKNRPDV